MSKKVTTASFIAKSREIHGDRYVYDKTVYVSAKSDVVITCPIEDHGDFPCTPSNHTHKTHPRGCPICGGSKRLTWEEFVNRSKKANPDIWIYPTQEYINAKTEVRLVCKKAGHIVKVTPDSLLQNGGCKYCRNISTGERSMLSAEVISARLKEKTANTDSDVVLVEGSYRGMNQPATLECSIHGTLEPRLVKSIFSSPHPCILCAGTEAVKGYSSSQAKQILEEHFDEKYKIKDFVYVGKATKVTLVCPKHGPWQIRFGSYPRSRGCRMCLEPQNMKARKLGLRRKAKVTRARRFEAWLRICRETHGDKFDYSNVVYMNQKSQVQITCPIHGDFWQLADSHKRSGCRDCADEDLGGLYSKDYFASYPDRKERPAVLYYLKFTYSKHVWYKVGVTVTSPKERFSYATANGVIFEILELAQTTLYAAWQSEGQIQKNHGNKFRDPDLTEFIDTSKFRIGHTECFTQPLSVEALEEYFR